MEKACLRIKYGVLQSRSKHATVFDRKWYGTERPFNGIATETVRELFFF